MGWSCEGEIKRRWAAAAGQEDDGHHQGQRQPHFLDTHFDCWVSRWPLRSDLKRLRVVPHLQEHLPINCVFVNIKKKRFLLVFLSTLHVFVSFEFLWQFWEICSFKMAGQTEVPFPPPCWTLDVIRGRQGLWLHYWKTPWPFVCIFVPESVSARCVSVCGTVCVSVSCCTQIYCTKTASAICHHGELTHELNFNKEQLYLKQYAILCGQL